MTAPSSTTTDAVADWRTGEAAPEACAVRLPSDHFHVPSLDGLRGVAVAIVVLSHTQLGTVIPGGFGVTIFFFLSGYLITTLLRLELVSHGKISISRFYLRRTLRIFPPMYIALALATIGTVAVGDSVDTRTLLMQALHLTNYRIFLFHGKGYPLGTVVLWSLSVEEHFYLVYPAFYLWLSRTSKSGSRQALTLAALCFAVLAWRCLLIMGLHVSPDQVQHTTDTRVDSILFGCILAVWHNPAVSADPQLPPKLLTLLIPAAVAVLLGSIAVRNTTFRETFRYTAQGLALLPVFVACIRFGDRWPYKILNTAPARWLGLISYTLYLVHYTVIQLLERRHLGALTFPLAAVLALALSVAIYLVVERPAARLRKRLSRVT